LQFSCLQPPDCWDYKCMPPWPANSNHSWQLCPSREQCSRYKALSFSW
jgi:hypothetical protein